MQNSIFQRTVKDMKEAVNKKDVIGFKKSHWLLMELCRKYIVNSDREMLAHAWSEISSLLSWFYQYREPRWLEANQKMGWLEALQSITGSLKDARTAEEALAEIRKSKKDREILCKLHGRGHGVFSGELAKAINSSPNAVTNRLPGLEKKGLIVRYKRGKNSLIFLTPKGKGVVSELNRIDDENSLPDNKVALYADDYSSSSKFEDATGKMVRSDSFNSWRRVAEAA